MDPATISTEEIAEIADWIGIDATPQEIERVVDQLPGLLEVYEPLDDEGYTLEQRDRYTLSDLVFDPGEDEDPYNAFISKFTMAPTDESGPLAGMDVALKDNIAVAGIPMTCGSRVFEGAVPQHNATVANRFLENGARILGKTNMTEFAFGPAGENCRYEPSRNPVNPEHVTGGSSAGSAAAVAAGDVDAALGTDTGGSVRCPAALCGVVGLKPTWGAVPRFGFVELAYTLDHIGPMARDVTTTAKAFEAIAGPDPRDISTERAANIDIDSCTERVESAPDIEEYSFAVLEEHFGDHVDEAVSDHVRETIDELEAAGADVETVSVPLLELSHSLANSVLVTEFAAAFRARGTPFHRRESVDAAWHEAAVAAFEKHEDRFGELFRTKAIEGTYLLSRYDARPYVRARNVITDLRAEFADLLDGYDATISPTVPTVAPKLGRFRVGSDSEDEETDETGWALNLVSNTRAGNLTGFPALTVPSGEVDDLPVGVQFIGSEFDDAGVLELGRSFERFLGN